MLIIIRRLQLKRLACNIRARSQTRLLGHRSGLFFRGATLLHQRGWWTFNLCSHPGGRRRSFSWKITVWMGGVPQSILLNQLSERGLGGAVNRSSVTAKKLKVLLWMIAVYGQVVCCNSVTLSFFFNILHKCFLKLDWTKRILYYDSTDNVIFFKYILLGQWSIEASF